MTSWYSAAEVLQPEEELYRACCFLTQTWARQSRVKAFRFRKANFHLVKELVNAVQWQAAFNDMGPGKHCL